MSPDFQTRYTEIISEYLKTSEERFLLMAADLGREIVQSELQLEEIAELHEIALASFAANSPTSTVAETGSLVSAPLMELLMAYSLAYREQSDSRRLAEEIQGRRNAQLEALANIAGILAGPESLEEKQFTALNEVAEVLQADAVTLRRANEAGDELTLVGWAGTLLGVYQPPYSPTLSHQAFSTGETVVENDYGSNPGATPAVIESGVRSFLAHPVMAHGQIYGTVNALSINPDHFTPERVQILTTIADGLGVLLENARLYDDSVSRTAQLECLLSIAEILGQTIPFHRKVVRMLEQLVEVTGSYSARFRLPDANGRELILTASAGLDDEPIFKRPNRIGEETLAFQVFQSGTPLVIVDYQTHPDAAPEFENTGDRSVVLLPIAAGGKPSAMVSVDSNELNHFNPERVRLLTAIGEGLGNLLENERLAEELRSSTQEMAVVDEMAKILTSTLEIDHIYDQFAIELKKLVDFDRVTLMEVLPQTGTYIIRNTWGLHVPFLDIGREMPLEDSFIENAMESGTWTNIPTIDRLPDDPGYSYLSEAGLRSQVLAPLTSNDAVIGVVAVSSIQPQAFGQREQAILERLATQITPAVENARLYLEAQDRNQEIQRLNESTTRILESNPSALVVMRGENREVVMVNDSFCAGFKLDQNEIEGKTLLEILDWVGIEEWIRESLASSSGEGQKEMRYTDQDGNERWFLVYAVPLQVDDDTAYEEEILLVLNDVTEQKQQQERLQGHSRLASVGELAAGVAHEINNPLAAILGLSELIQMENALPNVTEDARKIQEAAERAARIVQNLLSFARKQESAKGYLDVASVVDRAIELKSHDFRLNNINVTTKHSNRVPLTMVDELQMVQVVLNILNNASQAIIENQQSGEITATTNLKDGKIRISITDNGPGISPEILQNVFDPFFTTKEVGQGTGLGLSICYGIVREHGGELWVESKLGAGATFYIELPLASDLTFAGNEDANDDTSSRSRLSIRILVVDDEPLFRESMSRMLSADGHDVVLASNGYEAWDLIQKDRFELILADLRMPGLDGQRLYDLVQEKSQDIAERMVFVTGDTASPTARNFLGTTGNPVLSKPFTIGDIRKLIESLSGSSN